MNVQSVDAKTYGPDFPTSSTPAGATSEDSSGPVITDGNDLAVTFNNPVTAGQTVLGVTISVRGRRTTTSDPQSRVADDVGNNLTATQTWTSSTFSTKTFSSNDGDAFRQYVQAQAGNATITFRIEVPSQTGTRSVEIDRVKLTVITAEPTTGGPVIQGQCTAADIHLVVDVSGSIAADFGGNLDLYKTSIKSFMAAVESGMPGTNWRLTSFQGFPAASIATSGWNGSPPNSFVDALVSDGWTPTADGIEAAIAGGTNPGSPLTNNANNIMIILTDGAPNVPLNSSASGVFYIAAVDAIAQAELARAAGWSTIVV
ncbi:MAG: VWA domain-containing protein, partial [Anaerolineae bacterium]|nr:VWA domain-containing protein [Anaerolineae bacterium]